MWSIMEQSYNELFREPMHKRNISLPQLTARDFCEHFTQHDISEYAVLRKDVSRLSDMQSTLRVRVRESGGAQGIVLDSDAARVWGLLEQHKVNAMKMLRGATIGAKELDGKLPPLPDLPEDESSMQCDVL
jgi:hypothetical protein